MSHPCYAALLWQKLALQITAVDEWERLFLTKLPADGSVCYRLLRNHCRARIQLWNLGVELDQYKLIWLEIFFFFCKPLLWNNIINKVFYYVLTQHQYITINTLVLATCFGFYQRSSGLSLLYGSTVSVHTHYGIP